MLYLSMQYTHCFSAEKTGRPLAPVPDL